MNLELDEKLSALIDGELTPIEEAELRGELERSPELRQRLVALEAVDGALRVLPGSEASASLKARLQERLAAEEAPRQTMHRTRSVSAPPRRTRSRMRWTAATAVAAALLALVLLSRPGDERTPALEPLAQNEDDLALDEIAVTTPRRPEIETLAPSADVEEKRAVEEFLAASAPDEELDATALAAADDADLDVIDVLDLLAALDLETTSG